MRWERHWNPVRRSARQPRLDLIPGLLALLHLLIRRALHLPLAVTRAGWLRGQRGHEAVAVHHRLPHLASPASLRRAFGLEAALLDLCQHRIFLVEFEPHELAHSCIDVLYTIESGRDKFGARRSLWVVHKTNDGLGGTARAIVAVLVETHIVGATALEVALHLVSQLVKDPGTFIVVACGET